MKRSITFRTVTEADDFLLFTCASGVVESTYYEDGVLLGDAGPFFPELFVDLTVSLDLAKAVPDEDTLLIRAGTEPEGWELFINRHGYLAFRSLADGGCQFRSPTPLTTFVEPTFRVALVIANVCRIARGTRWWREALTYSRIELQAARSPDAPLGVLGRWVLEAPDLAPVPSQVAVSPEACGRAWNTVRCELFDGRKAPAVAALRPGADGNSRAFLRETDEPDTLDVFSGPEVVRSDSYWLFQHISGVRPGRTRLRMNMASGYAHTGPGMSPRFFWSADLRSWQEARMLEPVDAAGRHYPLVVAPAASFYLSTSFPFLLRELSELLAFAGTLPFVREQIIGHSVEGRPLHVLTATDPDVAEEDKVQIVMIGGQHSPMEMVGAHFIRPMLQYFADHPEVLRTLSLHCVPIVNVDGAAHGSDGMNLNLRNTNRCWFDDLQPETACIREHFAAQPVAPDLFLDVHSGGCWRNHTLLRLAPAFLLERFGEHGQELIDEQLAVNRLLEEHAGIRHCDGVDHGFRECCAKDWFKVRFPGCVSCDLELSLCTYFDPIARVTRPVDQASLAVVGNGLAAALTAFASS